MAKEDQPNKKTSGELLKEVRTSRRITLEDVHTETKIPLDVLRAIEEGYTVSTLSPFYLKGFMKMYARFLGVDVESVVFQEAPVEEPPSKTPIGTKIEPKKDFGRVWSSEIKQLVTRRRQKQIVQVIGVLIVLFCIVKIGGCMKRHFASKTSQSKKITKRTVKITPKPKSKPKMQTSKKAEPKKVAAKVTAKESTKPVAPKVPPQQVKTTKASAPKKETKGFKLTITAQKNGWLQVKVDGNLVFQSTMKEGMTETWSAKDNIEISGKSIHYLAYKLDGRELLGLNDTNQTARRVIVTKKGLSVKK